MKYSSNISIYRKMPGASVADV